MKPQTNFINANTQNENRSPRSIRVSTLVKIYCDKKATLIHIEKTY